MRTPATALRALIFVGEDDVWQHRPLHHEIVLRARAAGLAGASAVRGGEGFGTAALVHTTRLLDLAEGLPVVVIVVDAEDRVRAFLDDLAEVLAGATVVLDHVEVVRYHRDGSR